MDLSKPTILAWLPYYPHPIEHEQSEWMSNDLSRDDGPAYMNASGEMGWFTDGKHHRIGLPAFISDSCDMIWCENNVEHRNNGPAVINSDGLLMWYSHSVLSEMDGPAVVYPSGEMSWVVCGEEITDEVNNWMEENDICYPFTPEELILFRLTFGE